MYKEKVEMKTSSFKIPRSDFFNLLITVAEAYKKRKIARNSLSHYLIYIARETTEIRKKKEKEKMLKE